MKEQIERAKKIWDSKIFQTLATVATIGFLSWGWSAYHSVNALPDSLETIEAKQTADSTLFATEIAEMQKATEETTEKTEVRLRDVEDAQLEYGVKQDEMGKKIDKILEKVLDED